MSRVCFAECGQHTEIVFELGEMTGDLRVCRARLVGGRDCARKEFSVALPARLALLSVIFLAKQKGRKWHGMDDGIVFLRHVDAPLRGAARPHRSLSAIRSRAHCVAS